MVDGSFRAAFSLSEAGAGSDAAAVRAQARRVGDGWVLEGEKAWVTNGDTADLLVTIVRTDTPDERRGRRGMSVFLIPADTDGVEPGKPEDKMGLRSSRTTTITPSQNSATAFVSDQDFTRADFGYLGASTSSQVFPRSDDRCSLQPQ